VNTTDTHTSQHLPLAFSSPDLETLRRACYQLEHPSLAAKLSSVVGTPIEIGLKLLPKDWYDKLHTVLESAIEKALYGAVRSLESKAPIKAAENHTSLKTTNRFHTSMAACTGAVGGLFGLPGLLLEIPISTTLMLRSIADIAKSQGESLRDTDTQAACGEVFALGGRSSLDDAAETGYYGVRLALSSYMTSSLGHIAHQGVKGNSAPLLAKLIGAVVKPFGVTLSQRAAVRLIPIVSAATSATVNTIYMHHFQSMASAHFTVRKLERCYGKNMVQAQYDNFAEGF
jgi:hypothetical protein